MYKKILIIDDEQDVVDIVKTILKAKNYMVITSNNGEEGLRIIKEQKPDLVLCDLMMPKISGLEVCRRLRKDEEIKDTPIIVMSAIGKDSDRPEEFWRQGLKADDFISKPFEPLDLLGRIEYIFRRQAYVSTQVANGNINGNGSQSSSGQSAGLVLDFPSASPEEIVKIFIESWNIQRFRNEYRCIGDEMMYGLSEDEYVRRRHECYHHNKDQQRIQKLKSVINSSVNVNLAKVSCEKETISNNISEIIKEDYVLKKTSDGWKIVSVKIRR